MELNRERKYILIAGAVLLICGLVYRFYPMFTDIFSVNEKIAVMQAQVQRYQTIIAKKKGLEKDIRSLRNRLKELEKSLLTGTTTSLAAVNLQDFIKKIAEAENIDIETMRVMSIKQKEDAKYTSVPVRFVIESNIRQLKNLLFQIESAPKLLIIRELDMDSLAHRGSGKIRSIITVEGMMTMNNKSQNGGGETVHGS